MTVIPTPETPPKRRVNLVETAALFLLAVFVVTATIGGFAISIPVGFFCLAGCSLVASLILGWGS